MNTARKKTLAIAGLAAAICIATISVLIFRFDRSALVYDWQPGMTYSYRLAYTTENETSIPMQGSQGAQSDNSFNALIDLETALRFKVYEKNDDVFKMGVSLFDVTKSDMEMMGQPVVSSSRKLEEVLGGQEAIVEMTELGEIQNLYFPKDSPPMFKNLVQTLLGELQVRLRGTAVDWRTEEDNTLGSSINRYGVESIAGPRVHIAKRRERYTKINAVVGELSQKAADVRGEYSIVFHRDGHLDSIKGQESIDVSQNTHSSPPLVHVDTRVVLTLLSIEQFTDTGDIDNRMAAMESRGIGDIVVSEEATRRALEQRAAGMDAKRVARDIVAFGNAQQMPFGHRWLWRAVGAMRLNPKECRLLIDAFHNPKVHTRGKNLVLELLAATGHEEAQAALLEILSEHDVQADPGFPQMIQRVASLEHPNEKVVDFVRQQFVNHRNAMTPKHFAAAYTMAGVARTVALDGKRHLAEQLNNELKNLLETADDSRAQYHYLLCLGATQMEENADVIAAFADSDDPKLRRATVTALRGIQNERSEQIVGTLLADTDAHVQSRALNVLSGYDWSEDQMNRLYQIVNADQVKRNNLDQVANILAEKMKEQPEYADLAHQTLARLLERDLPAKVRYQVRRLLDAK